MTSYDTNPPRSYLEAAFTNQYNVILFGGSVLFSIALFSTVPLVCGLIAEALWLLVGPRLPAFQRRADGFATEDEQSGPAQAAEAATVPLEPAYAHRLAAITRMLSEIQRFYAAQPGMSPQDRTPTLDRLQRLQRSFLEFAAVHQRLSGFIAASTNGELEREVQALKQAYSAEKDLGVRLTVRQALSLAERRVKQVEQVVSTRRAVEVRLDTIEKSFSYARTCVMSLASPHELHAELDTLAAQIGSAAELERATTGASSGAQLHPGAQ